MKHRMAICALVLALALCLLLAACGSAVEPDDEKPKTDPYADAIKPPALEVYSQKEHVGWGASLDNAFKYPQYFNMGEAAFLIPGLVKAESFVLQGIDYYPAKNWALLSGYVSPKRAKNPNSVIFVLDMSKRVILSDGSVFSGALIKEILLDEQDGGAYEGHAGGLAVTQKNLWLSDDGKLYRISLSDIESAPASSHIALSDSVSVPVNASYTSYADGILWVGEFESAADKYVTDASHHKSSSLTAWTVGYRLGEDGEDGFDEATGFRTEAMGSVVVPDVVLWHGEKIQGMTVAGNKIVLSQSYGRTNDSYIFIYDDPRSSEASDNVTIEGSEVPCYILSKPSQTLLAPPMTEDLGVIFADGEYSVLVATESGGYYYYGYANLAKNPMDMAWRLIIAQ